MVKYYKLTQGTQSGKSGIFFFYKSLQLYCKLPYSV